MPQQVYVAQFGLVDFFTNFDGYDTLHNFATPSFCGVYSEFGKAELESILEHVMRTYREMRDEDVKIDFRVESGTWSEPKPNPNTNNGFDRQCPSITYELYDDERWKTDHREGMDNFGVLIAVLVVERVDTLN